MEGFLKWIAKQLQKNESEPIQITEKTPCILSESLKSKVIETLVISQTGRDSMSSSNEGCGRSEEKFKLVELNGH